MTEILMPFWLVTPYYLPIHLICFFLLQQSYNLYQYITECFMQHKLGQK
jgi:hypothetical protein